MTQYGINKLYQSKISIRIFLLCVSFLFASSCRELYFKATPNRDFCSTFYNGDSKLKEFEVYYIMHRPSERVRKMLRLYEEKDLEFIENMLLNARPLINILDNDNARVFFKAEGFHMGSISTRGSALYKIFTLQMPENIIYLGVASEKRAYYFADTSLIDKLKNFIKEFECSGNDISFNFLYEIEKKGFVLYEKNIEKND